MSTWHLSFLAFHFISSYMCLFLSPCIIDMFVDLEFKRILPTQLRCDIWLNHQNNNSKPRCCQLTFPCWTLSLSLPFERFPVNCWIIQFYNLQYSFTSQRTLSTWTRTQIRRVDGRSEKYYCPLSLALHVKRAKFTFCKLILLPKLWLNPRSSLRDGLIHSSMNCAVIDDASTCLLAQNFSVTRKLEWTFENNFTFDEWI